MTAEWRARAVGIVVLWLVLGAAWQPAHAGALRYCDPPADLSAAQKDQLFRFGAVIKAELDASGHSLALISRSGLDLNRFGVRYSHAGVSLKASQNTAWSVRQLYYACDEHKPKVFDQGISGFLLGLNDPAVGYVSVVLMPPAEAESLERAVLDDRRAVQALAATYSANAYAFGHAYQNCNQWLAEMLAGAWGRFEDDADLRFEAQRWLKARGYTPSVFDVGWRPLMWLGAFIPWLHSDDHPAEDIAAHRYRVSMPESIEAFVRASVPGATRIEFCHTGRRVVIHRGWDAIAEGCVPSEQDTVIVLD